MSDLKEYRIVLRQRAMEPTGDIAVEVFSGNEYVHNIWTVNEKELTPGVTDAIRSAYARGYEQARNDVSRLSSMVYVSNTIEDQREE